MDEIRISDFFKKNKPDKNPPAPSPQDQTPSPKTEQPGVDVRLSSVYDQCVMPAATVDTAALQALYGGLYARIVLLYKQEVPAVGDVGLWMAEPVAKIADYFAAGPKDLLNLCSADYPADDYFVCRHAANVCVLSVYIGSAMGLERARLIDLGMAAGLHDIGMPAFNAIIRQKRELTKDEFSKVRQHPAKGLEIAASLIKGLSHVITEAMVQEHERADGSGYPKGLKGGALNAFGQIISLVDVYEAMLHARPWRSRHNPLVTIKTILEHKALFAAPVLKVLIEGVGIFPVGMAVRLNTKEIGVVVKGNPKLPLRPVIDVLIDAKGDQLKCPRELDLAANSAVYIEECLERLEAKKT